MDPIRLDAKSRDKHLVALAAVLIEDKQIGPPVLRAEP